MHGQPNYASTTATASGATGASHSSTGKAKTRVDATVRGRGFVSVLTARRETMESVFKPENEVKGWKHGWNRMS
jgi:hypothetical protein